MNKAFGLVEFRGIELSSDMGGYVFGSSIKLYSTVHTYYDHKHALPVQMLNIVHIHLNDSSDDVSIEVAYMTNEQTSNDFK